MEDTESFTKAAEKEWLETWVAGPRDERSKLLEPGTNAPLPLGIICTRCFGLDLPSQ